MRYERWDAIAGRPNIVVDGYPTNGTVLTLSHWRGSGTPEVLKDDLSTQIAFRYLDHPELLVDADLVTNNHFDQDGCCGIFAVLHPDEALARRARIIDVASAGDFDTFTDRDSARIAFALATIGDYDEALPQMIDLLDHPERFRARWEEEDARLSDGERAVRDGRITIEDRPDLDLAIVTMKEDAPVHPGAIHNATPRMRILEMRGRAYRLYYRYESWVDYRSRPVPARVDLAPLAKGLNDEEPGWEFDGNDDLTPSLRHVGESSISPEEFRARIEAALARR